MMMKRIGDVRKELKNDLIILIKMDLESNLDIVD